MRIPPATRDDLPALHEVFLHRFHVDRLPDRLRIPPEDGLRAFDERVRGSVDEPDALVLVAEADGCFIGCAQARLEAPPNPFQIPRTICLLDNLVVTEDRRGRGVGTALTETVEAWARNRGATEVQLTVWDFPEGARGFYAHLGYRVLRHQMAKDL